MAVQLNIIVDDPKWKDHESYELLQNLFEQLLEKTLELEGKIGNFEVNLLLTSNNEIQKLNHQFRQKDFATNVLSFPQSCAIDTVFNDEIYFLGDLAFGLEKIMQESKEFNISFLKRVSHLFVHGIFHLLGLDHLELQERQSMEKKEIEVLNYFGMQDPYILEGE